jgi:hypothetical protein
VDLSELLNELSEEQLAALERREDLGTLQFGPAIANLRLIRAWATAAAAQDPSLMFASLRNEIPAHLSRAVAFVQQIRDFDLTQIPNPSDVHRSIIAEVEGEKDWFAQAVSPYIRIGEVEVAALRSEAVDAVQATSAAAAEAQELLSRIRVAAGSAGAANVSTYYSGQASVHETQARRFLWVGGVAVAATLATAMVFFVLAPPQAREPDDWLVFMRETLARVFIIGVPAYVATFCLRNYRVNKHLQVVNEQKRTALDTYPLFTESVSDDATRALIAVELLRATVGITDTGYLGNQPDKTILETPPVIQFPQRPPSAAS